MTQAQAIAAQQLASALYNTQFDDVYWDQAIQILGGYIGEDRQAVAQRALQLGADASAMAQLMTLLGEGETIEITGTAPTAPINYVMIGALALGAWLLFGTKKKRRA